MRATAIFSLSISLTAFMTAWAQEPALPTGLTNGTEPTPSFSAEPTFNMGGWNEESLLTEEAGSPATFAGFWEARVGVRTRDDAYEKPYSLGETRAQGQIEKVWDNVTGKLTVDALYDPVNERHALDLEQGRGWLDVREANLLFRPLDNMDVKIGRQILTWGTGDLVFINDMFPKDWNSFFNGRDVEYLKAPSDAVKVSVFGDIANLDVVYTPRFDNDRHIDGHRLSYFNANTNQLAGRNAPIRPDYRQDWFDEDEIALRLYRHLGAYEVAGYLYSGYWKSPAGQTNTAVPIFPNLNVYGLSIRGPLGKGIANAEAGYYQSRDDAHGTNPNVDNSQIRYLVGYEQELWPNMTGSAQYYVEDIRQYNEYLQNLPAGVVAKDKRRELITVRLTQLLMQQNLKLSLFNFWSPTDVDGHTRLLANYKLDDHWQVETGANLFYSSKPSTFFGGFQDNANIFVGLRYGF